MSEIADAPRATLCAFSLAFSLISRIVMGGSLELFGVLEKVGERGEVAPTPFCIAAGTKDLLSYLRHFKRAV